MALPHPKQSFLSPDKIMALSVLCILMLQSCQRQKKIYKSDCNIDKTFKQISFKQLLDSIDDYNQQYIEISGKYQEDKGISALVNDSLFTDHSTDNALWVDFSQDCPLYLSGTHQGLFEYNDGQFTQINNRMVTIRGLVTTSKGPHKRYKATIERISFVKL